MPHSTFYSLHSSIQIESDSKVFVPKRNKTRNYLLLISLITQVIPSIKIIPIFITVFSAIFPISFVILIVCAPASQDKIIYKCVLITKAFCSCIYRSGLCTKCLHCIKMSKLCIYRCLFITSIELFFFVDIISGMNVLK